jgi:hypothetical protein
VTALTRAASTSTFPAAVAVKKVDYGSAESLQDALAGQDAVLSLVASAATGGQKPLVDAAVAAGVKLFIPSEFGINTRAVSGAAIGKILGNKVATADYLAEKAAENPGFTWTGISTGVFFDWVGLYLSLSFFFSAIFLHFYISTFLLFFSVPIFSLSLSLSLSFFFFFFFTTPCYILFVSASDLSHQLFASFILFFFTFPCLFVFSWFPRPFLSCLGQTLPSSLAYFRPPSPPSFRNYPAVR